MTERANAFLRGAAQGATLGWGDEGTAKIIAALNAIAPPDPEGLPKREYAAGSLEQDALNNIRAENDAARAKQPLNYNVGQVLGQTPLALSLPAARGVAAGAGIGAGMGAVSGAGHSSEGSRTSDALKGGATGGMFGATGSALSQVAPAVMRMFKDFGGPPSPPTAVTATEGANGVITPRMSISTEIQPQIQINRANLPPRPPPGEFVMPDIPRPGRTLSEGEKDFLESMSAQKDDIDSALNQELIGRSMAQESARKIPLDPVREAEKVAAKKARLAGEETSLETLRPLRKR